MAEVAEGSTDGEREGRRLTLLRHGRAASPGSATDDHERPLTESGRRDVTAILSLEAVRADPPERVICSDARRTRETAACVLETLGLDAACLESDGRLYLAPLGTLLAIVAEHDARPAAHLMIVGHNPGLETLAAALDARSMPEMPTAALCRFARRRVAGEPGRIAARLLFETAPPR